ncbi:hypothetical protein HX004_00830 [Myroides sp. 1354]|uniref:hypothetical protein n=1 Tax=unclassified Myroides TaxID=2642485 RepID=UPI0025760683|nr:MULTISPECIES: hypothetical protein [unclassified Myroides]MDM1043619.1 hypothetical protein [Myroides sp. R163-1]MDM1054331.1 hypothetical protein [Myroides sp. 1354]MDM1067627.1 hypothetical protein [Myroides sp. 1372]
MNSSFEEKKINLYKQQLKEIYANSGIIKVLHGEELAVYWKYNQSRSIESSVERKEYSYYDSTTHVYLDKEESYVKAKAYFLENRHIFSEGEVVIFFLRFKEEYFGLKLLFDSNEIAKMTYNHQVDLLLINEDLTKLLGLDILEYVIEVVVIAKV